MFSHHSPNEIYTVFISCISYERNEKNVRVGVQFIAMGTRCTWNHYIKYIIKDQIGAQQHAGV